MGTTDNTFTNSGPGEQNSAQGDHPIGKQENSLSTTGNQSPAIVAGGNVSVSYNSNSAPPPVIPEPCKVFIAGHVVRDVLVAGGGFEPPTSRL